MKSIAGLKFNRIWKKLAMGAGITVLLTMLAINYIGLSIDRSNALSNFEAELDSMANVAAHALETPLWNLTEETVTSISDSLFQNRTVAYVVVRDRSLGILYDKKNEGIEYNDELLVTIEKIIYHKGKDIGSIELSMTTFFIDQQNLRNLKIGFIETLIMIVLLIFMLTILISRITRPLGELEKSLKLVTTNSERVPQIEIKGNDEISALSYSFNEMSIGIREARRAINQLNEELEGKVNERTLELNEKNMELQSSLEIIEKTRQELLDSNENLSKTLNDLHEAQDSLVEQGKMALLGELVAGVAHEINTPIGISLTTSSYIEKTVKELLQKVSDNNLNKVEFLEYLDNLEVSSSSIVRNLERAGELITSFKKISVDQSNDSMRKFNFKEYLATTILNLQSQYKNRTITIQNNCPDDLELFSYAGAYAQIFTNLIMNSLIHAFEKKDEGHIIIDAEIRGEMLTVIFIDNGHGISKDVQQKIFNPFFTTKRNEGGTGLGLNIVYNTVTSILKGSIVCSSEPGIGTTFVIKVPYNHPDAKAFFETSAST